MGTPASARATGELVVNVVDRANVAATNASSSESGPEHEEFDFAGVTGARGLVPVARLAGLAYAELDAPFDLPRPRPPRRARRGATAVQSSSVTPQPSTT